jgi:riboflavin synthase
MFTGLVEEIAVIKRIDRLSDSARMRIAAKRIFKDIKLGDSISVNGVCLTVVEYSDQVFAVDVVPETMRRSNLGLLRPGDRVNVERALRLGDRLGGHIVAGHVDGVGTILDKQGEGLATVLTIAAAADVLRYVVEKGSVCVDGTSLTVMNVTESNFRISVIPHTGEETTLLEKLVGAKVNLESDVIGKYVEKLLIPGVPNDVKESRRSTLDLDYLRTHGFA